jgi:cyclopropane fatty-acyl-phospholipid synthase-like methyltransferase
MEDFLQAAISPNQYDSQLIDWKKTGLKDSPIRKFIQYYLTPELDIKNKRILDIGCGMGPMMSLFEENNVKEVVGIDPSKNNIKFAKELYPQNLFIESTLENYVSDKKFDAALAVMVFEHIKDIETAFKKVFSLLNDNGFFYLVIGDKDYFTKPRFGYELNVQKVDDNTFVTKTKRDYGVIYDILRSTVIYFEAIKKAGFKIKKHLPIMPNNDTIKIIPRYQGMENTTILHLIVLEK